LSTSYIRKPGFASQNPSSGNLFVDTLTVSVPKPFMVTELRNPGYFHLKYPWAPAVHVSCFQGLIPCGNEK